MDFTKQSTLRFELCGSATAAALFGAATCYGASPGLNWAVWTAMVATELAVFARPQLGANRTAFSAVLASAVILAAGAAVTTNTAAIALIFLTVATLLAVATRLAAGVPVPVLRTVDLAASPFVATVQTTREACFQLSAAAQSAFTPTGARVVRGAAIAIPVLGIFTALLAAADPTLSSWMHALSVVFTDWSWLPRFVLFCALGTLSLGAFALATKRFGSEDVQRHVARSNVLSDTERRIVVGAVDALFALFLFLQLLHPHPPHGESYTTYVHKGFAQLTIVATLSMLLVARLHHGRPRVGIPWGTLALLGEVELLVGSALHRITVYQRTFGYTQLRVWVTAYLLLVAALVVLLALEVARPRLVDANRFVRRGALLAISALIVLVYGNPDAWVANLELARYRATGKISVYELGSLSPDATPSVLAIANALPADCDAWLRYYVRLDRTHPRRWFEWNARAVRADHARRGVADVPTTILQQCQLQPW